MNAKRPQLLLFSAAPVEVIDRDHLRLDGRFVSGMRLHARFWNGPVTTVLRLPRPGAAALTGPEATSFRREDLGFDLRLLTPDEPIAAGLMQGAVPVPGVVLASVDMADQAPLAEAARLRGLSVVYGVEHTLDSRLALSMGDQRRGMVRRLWSAAWYFRQERARRNLLRQADAIQINGFAAAAAYAGLSRNPLRYFDSRMTKALLATSRDTVLRDRHHVSGGVLRLIYAAPLEPRQGAHQLLPLASMLAAAGLPVHLAIYGNGSLASDIGVGISARGLGERVQLHPALPFETGLVPVMRRQGDIFLSLRTQPDPTGAYIEAMGAGLPVLGFDNAMLSPMIRQSHAGWTVPMNRLRQTLRKLEELNRDRAQVAMRSAAAVAYARRHNAETEFAARMDHLAKVFSETNRSSRLFDATPSARDRAKS